VISHGLGGYTEEGGLGPRVVGGDTADEAARGTRHVGEEVADQAAGAGLAYRYGTAAIGETWDELEGELLGGASGHG
jgi:hypothetical protein